MDLLRSLPLGLYLEQPITWLHRLDPRVKLIWLLSFLIAPLLGNPLWRLSLVLLLILLTLLARIPLRVWRQQMGWLLTLCSLVFVLTSFAPDGLAVKYQPHRPSQELAFDTPTLAQSSPGTTPAPWYSRLLGGPATQKVTLPQPTDYNYVLWKFGRFKMTQRSLDLAIRISTLLFTLIYSSTLYLLTTAPEEITAGLEDLMQPLRRLKVPVTEIALTLTLSLRFIPLVLEEIQNLVRSVQTRAINWKKLGFRRTTQVWLLVVERLLENLLLRADQIANAMKVRGFTSPNQHQVQWHQLKLRSGDWLALAGLLLLWGARFVWGGQA